MKNNDRSYHWLWLSLALLPLLFIALLLPVTPHDYWWYLRLGRDIMQTGAVPSVETYSFTWAGAPIINKAWLGAVLLWLAYDLGGLNLTFFLRALLIGLSYGLLWLWLLKLGSGARLATFLTLIAGLAGSNNWAFRPQLFGYPLFAFVLLLLWQWQSKKSRALWLLPIISCLWTNIHGSFLLFFVLGGSALLFGTGDRKRLLIVLIASFFASFIHPFGFDNWRMVIETYSVSGSQTLSGEWMPPTNTGWQLNIFFAWVLLMAPLAASSSRRLSTMEWIWLLGMVWMAISGVRYIVWTLFLLAMATGKLLSDWDSRWLDTPLAVRLPALNYAFGIIILVIPLLALPFIREAIGMKAPPVVSPDTPIQATSWLADHPDLPGSLWSDMIFSSYLIYALPSRPVWIDTRFEIIYPPEQYELYSKISSSAQGWQKLFDEQDINLLMLSKFSQPVLIKAVRDSNEWCEVYQDSLAVIFTRRASQCL